MDIRLNVHGDNVTITQGALNGKVVAADDTELNNLSIPFGQPFTIQMKPEHGFNFNGLRVRHGYNLTGDSLSTAPISMLTSSFHVSVSMKMAPSPCLLR